MTARAFVVGCAGASLTDADLAFLRDADPFGLILFRRNIGEPEQVRALTASFRSAVGRDDAPVLIDQEGGRVQRMGPPHWPKYPPGRAYASLAGMDGAAADLVRLGARLMAADLSAVGITVDCLPVLDVPVPGAHDIIGDRAYGDDPGTVAEHGRAAVAGLLEGGVLPVMKHVPGHGRAAQDSHEALPRVSASLDALRARDFVPFRALRDCPAAMSAHVVYEAIDPERPGTISPAVIGTIVRGEIGFDGLLFTDDLSMRALSGGFRERAEQAYAAGCDVALHCNGDLDEMRAVAEAAPRLAGAALRRAEAALARIATPADPTDLVDERLRFAAALARLA